MLAERIEVENIYVVCGYTDMRKSIHGLTAIVIQQFRMKPDERSIFLFCGRKADRMKAILWEEDGFLMLYKVLENYKYQWPRNQEEVRAITPRQYQRLLEGLSIERQKARQPKDWV